VGDDRPGVVMKYPLLVRFGTLFACAVLGLAVLRNAATKPTMAVGAGAICLAVAVFSYRAEVNTTEVRVRYLPFYVRRAPLGDITQIVQKRTTVLVTRSGRISLWGLTPKAREDLSQILPARLYAGEPRIPTQAESAAVVRRHAVRTLCLAVGFVLTALFSVPFLNDNRWHPYADDVGRYVLLACLIFFMLFLFQGAIAWALWSYRRDIAKIDDRLSRHKR
jgi:hypothetical protein